MNLEHARKVVVGSPKTELGLASRLVLWELERLEELGTDGQPRIDALQKLVQDTRIQRDEAERQRTALQLVVQDANRTIAREQKLAAAQTATANQLAARVKELEGADKSELERLRAMEKAVWEVLDAPTVFTPTRSIQNKIRAHLAPYLKEKAA